MTESSRGVENLSAVFAYLQYTRVSRWNSYEVLPVEVIDKDVFEKDVSFELCPPSCAQKQVNREYHRKIDKGEGQMATAIFGVCIYMYIINSLTRISPAGGFEPGRPNTTWIKIPSFDSSG